MSLISIIQNITAVTRPEKALSLSVDLCEQHFRKLKVE